MFETTEMSAKTLYAVMGGDNILATFQYLGIGNIVCPKNRQKKIFFLFSLVKFTYILS